jgi:hypothetical protein
MAGGGFERLERVQRWKPTLHGLDFLISIAQQIWFVSAAFRASIQHNSEPRAASTLRTPRNFGQIF